MKTLNITEIDDIDLFVLEYEKDGFMYGYYHGEYVKIFIDIPYVDWDE